MPPGHPCLTGHSHHPEMNTGERYASKGARTVRGGADGKGKGPEPRAPRRAAYFTLWEPEGETPSGHPTDEWSVRLARAGDVRLLGVHVQTTRGEAEERDDVHDVLSGDQPQSRYVDPAADLPDALSPAQRPVLQIHRPDDQLEGGCVGGVLRAILPVRKRQRPIPHRPIPRPMGPPQVQTPTASTTTSSQESWPTSSVPGQDSSRTGDGRPCNERLQHEPDDRSPVSREVPAGI